MTENAEKPFWKLCHTTARDKRNQRFVVGWALAWAVAWVGVSRCLKTGRLVGEIPAIAAISVTTGLGLGMLLAYRHFLREADELRRKIELDALALAVGVGLVGGVGFRLLQQSGVVTGGDNFEVTVLLIAATQAIGVIMGLRRYA